MTLDVRASQSVESSAAVSPKPQSSTGSSSECLEHVLGVPPALQLLKDLRAIRNSVIGSRDRKSVLVMQGRIPLSVLLAGDDRMTLIISAIHFDSLVALLLYPFPELESFKELENAADIRCLAAAILNSLAHSAPAATLHLLLKAQTHTYLQHSLASLVDMCQGCETNYSSRSPPQAYLKLLESLLRAQRALLLTLSEELSSSPRWGVGAGWAAGPSSWATSSRNGPSEKKAEHTMSARHNVTSTTTETSSKGASLKHRGVYTYEWRAALKVQQVVIRLVPLGSVDPHAASILESSSIPLDADSLHFTLARQAITVVFSPEKLPLLLGSLFLAPLPPAAGSLAFTDMRASKSSNNELSSAPWSREGTRPNSPLGRPLVHRSHLPFGSKADLSDPLQHHVHDAMLPLATRARLLSISEIVCGIIARCLGIPGLPPPPHLIASIVSSEHSSREGKARDASMNSDLDSDAMMTSSASIGSSHSEASGLRIPSSPEDEITDRRTRVVAFKALSSPFRTAKARRLLGLDAAFPDGLEESGSRGEGQADLEASTVLQAELVRKKLGLANSELFAANDVLSAILDAIDSGYAKVSRWEYSLLKCCTTVLTSAAVSTAILKTQEAAMWALCELVRSNSQVCLRLFKTTTPSGQLPTSALLSLRRDPSPSVRLAAFSCLAHIVRLHPFSHRTNLCVLEGLLDLLDEDNGTTAQTLETSSGSLSNCTDIQTQAAFALAGLVESDESLQMIACDDMNAMQRLVALLDKSAPASAPDYVLSPNSRLRAEQQITHGTPFGSTNASVSSNNAHIDESLIRLREGALTALAALAFRRDEIRRMFVDTSSPPLLPSTVASLSAGAVGIRVAACRLVRSLSRAVAVLRTSLVDAGVAGRLLSILKDDDEHPDVKSEATATICNLVVQFSPMRQMLLDAGGMEQLVETAMCGRRSGDVDASRALGTARINALWALKNLVYAAETNVKELVMRTFGWDNLLAILTDDEEDPLAREQALNIVRNLLCSKLRDADMTYEELGRDKLLDVLEHVIWHNRDDAIIEQAAFIIVNIATGSTDHSGAILDRPNLLNALHFFLSHPRAAIRNASVWALSNLTDTPTNVNPPLTAAASTTAPTDIVAHAITRLRAFGFEEAVRKLLDDEELDVRDRAKSLLQRFE